MALKDIVRIGRVMAIHPGFRCTLRSYDTMSDYLAIVNPSPYGATYPEVGALVYYYNTHTLKRVIGCIHDTPSDNLPVQEADENDGNFPDMSPGDAFVGKYGRAYFYKTGDVRVGSWFNRSEIYFGDNGDLDVNGLNFYLHTKDDGVEMYTTSPTDGSFGNKLFINRNTNDLNLLPAGQIAMDELGKTSISVGDGTLYHSKAIFDITGDIKLLNDMSGIEMMTTGLVNVFAGATSFGASTAYLSLEPAGNAYLGANIGLDLSGTQTLDISSLKVTIGSNTTIGGPLTVNGASTINAPLVVNSPGTINGPLTIGGALATQTFAASGVSVLSGTTNVIGPTNMSGALVATGSATFSGKNSFIGETSIVGAANFLGAVSFVGVEGGSPFVDLAYRAIIPVIINGSVYNIPCL